MVLSFIYSCPFITSHIGLGSFLIKHALKKIYLSTMVLCQLEKS